MARGLCCENDHVNKGAWTKVEDEKLMTYIKTHGQGCWRSLPKAAGLLRCGKSCRLRWINYLRPDVKRGNFTAAEVELIIKLHSKLGNKWSTIAANLPGRTDNEIKNHWNTHIKRKLLQKGIDPQTHRPIAVEDGASTAATNMFPLSRQDLAPRPPLVRDQANSSTGPSPHGGAPHHSISYGKISHKPTILDNYGHRPGPSVALSLLPELPPIPDTSVDLPIVPLLKTSLALPNPPPAVGNDGGASGGRTSNMNSHGICLCLNLGITNCNPCRKERDQSRSSSQDLRKENTCKRTYNDY